jgi:hypothetical protein
MKNEYSCMNFVHKQATKPHDYHMICHSLKSITIHYIYFLINVHVTSMTMEGPWF